MKHPRQRTYPTWITLLGPRGLLSVKGLLCVVYGVGTYSQILVRQLRSISLGGGAKLEFGI
jgi:hypothetical protein